MAVLVYYDISVLSIFPFWLTGWIKVHQIIMWDAADIRNLSIPPMKQDKNLLLLNE